MLQQNRHMIQWQENSSVLRPLDEHQGFRVEDVLPTQVCQLLWPAEAIQIEVVNDGPHTGVLVHERERRARYIVRHAIATTDRPHQGRLAGAEVTTESHEERRTYRAAKPLAPSGKLFLRDSEMTSRCQGRNRRRVACHLSEGALAAAARSTHGWLRLGRRRGSACPKLE